MFNYIIRNSIAYRYLVIAISLVMGVVGGLSYRHLIVDAVPDITNVQVQINTTAAGYSPFEVEQRITIPIELFLSGIPNLDYTRSISRYGLSQVTVVFEDETDIYFARQLISQRLQESSEKLPPGIVPAMGPVTTGLGEIFMFMVENEEGAAKKHTLQELREIQDWVVKPQLRTVPGVVEVNAIGGDSKQIIISPNVYKLQAFHLTFKDIELAIARNNANVGAGFIEKNGEQFLIRVPAQIKDYQELEDIVVAVHEGIPIRLSSVASVSIGSELRGGAATMNGHEVVLGTVFMLMGGNGREVSASVSKRIEEIQKSLPAGVIIKPVYDRSTLIDATIQTVKANLMEGALLVIVILFAALGNFRAALITACVIPLSMLITIFGMVQGKMSANLMSLGALDFGLIVDGAVILVENCIRRFGDAQAKLGRLLTKEERLDLVYKASSEVRQATMFGELIIMIVYVPILALSGVEGKMYEPMALTVILALAAAFVLSLTFVPAAVAVCITGPVKGHVAWLDWVSRHYEMLLNVVFRYSKIVLILTGAFFLSSLLLLGRLGSEFIPSLDEGDIALHALRIPGTSLSQAISMQDQLEESIREIPEVSMVFAKIGTAEIATDPMPPSVADGFIILKPRSEWSNPSKPKAELVAEIEKKVTAIPGNNYEFTQPIQMRFNELIAGVRSDVAVKVFGDDADVLLAIANQVEKLLSQISGASDVKVEQVTGLPIIVVRPKRDVIARLGLNISDIQDLVHTAYAGSEVSKFYQGDRNFPIVIRLAEEDRKGLKGILQMPIAIPLQGSEAKLMIEPRGANLKVEQDNRSYVVLSEVADVSVEVGPNQISRENAKRRVVVTANVRNRDIGSFVEEAQKVIDRDLSIPPSYWLAWGGQYENLISASRTLQIVIPLVMLTVFALIYLTFGSIRYTGLVFTGVPFALSGGVFALWCRGIPFSISAGVGFIALSGVSVLNSLVLVTFIKQLTKEREDTLAAIVEGAVSRVRPVLMTALVASLGFLPMALSQGTGSEVQRPLATVVIGGIISSTILTLVVLPLLIKITSRIRAKV